MVAMKTALILSILDRRNLVIMGAKDRYRVRLYRSQAAEATQDLPGQDWSPADKRKPYRYISQADKFVRPDLEKSERHNEEGNQKAKIRSFLKFEWPDDWRREPVSIIRCASFFPVLAITLWLIAFFSIAPQASLSE
jgi:hypothetical protein